MCDCASTVCLRQHRAGVLIAETTQDLIKQVLVQQLLAALCVNIIHACWRMFTINHSSSGFTGKPSVVQLLNYKKNGDPFINYLSITPIHDSRGHVTHFVGIQSDISDLVNHKKAELAAKHEAAQVSVLFSPVPLLPPCCCQDQGEPTHLGQMSFEQIACSQV